MKTFKEVLLLPITLVRAIIGIFRNADEYAKQHEYEESGWKKKGRKR